MGAPVKQLPRITRNKTFVARLAEVSPDIIPLESYLNTTTKIKCHCNICGHDWMVQPKGLLKGRGCPNCDKQRRRVEMTKTHEQFMSELAETALPVDILGRYINSKTPIRVRCRTCGREWEILPRNLKKSVACARCSALQRGQRTRMTNASFLIRLKSVAPNIEALSEYTDSKTNVHFRCKVCGYDWWRNPFAILDTNPTCPECKKRAKQKTQQRRRLNG